MFKLSWLKIIDEAVLPVCLVVASKIAGVLLAAYFFNLKYDSNQTVIFLKFSEAAATKTANSFALILMLIVILVGFGFVLLKAYYFHESHIHPKSSARLAKLKLANLIEGNFEIYHQAIIWLGLFWFVFFLGLVQFINGEIYWWLTAVALFFAVTLTSILYLDIKKEKLFTQDVNY